MGYGATKESGERLWQSRWEGWKARASEVHEGRYEYLDPKRQLRGGRQYLTIRCPAHGDFVQEVGKHLSGRGCPGCKADKISGARSDTYEGFLAKARARHGDTYSYSQQGFTKTSGMMQITCRVHGSFLQRGNKHLAGQGCAKCQGLGIDRRAQLQARFPDYDWSHVAPDTLFKSTVGVLCPVHGLRRCALPSLLMKKGRACPTCNKSKSRFTPEQWAEKVKQVHGSDLGLVLTSVRQGRYKAQFHCPAHGAYSSILQDVVNSATRCPRCAALHSRGEREVLDFVRSLGVDAEQGNRDMLRGLELDIVIPSHKLAIEYCGMWWHGEPSRGKEFHLMKLRGVRELGWNLITLFEDEWENKREQVQDRLRARLTALGTVGARQTQVIPLTWAQASEFLGRHHLQGAGAPSKTCLGLVSRQGDLLSVSVWGSSRFKKGHAELYRFCTLPGLRVIGALPKLLRAFLKLHPSVQVVHTYADRRWGEGGVYGRAGFERLPDTKAGFAWVKGVRRIARQNLQKHKLASALKVYDPLKTADENCIANGYWRIFDCGNASWQYTRKE